MRNDNINGRFILFGSTAIDDEAELGIPILIEADGTLRMQSVLWDGSSPVRELAEDDGTPKSVSYGKDIEGNQGAFRINEDSQLQVEIVNCMQDLNANLKWLKVIAVQLGIITEQQLTPEDI